MAGRSFPAAAFACALVLAACGGTAPPPPRPVHIVVGSSPHEVAKGTTFGALIEGMGLAAADGRLLSVTGSVLDPSAERGRILLNGHGAPMTTVLHEKDRVLVLDGEDRVESTIRTVTELGRRVGDPERTLATYPTKEITVSGRISGEVASDTIRSIGRGHAPREVALTFDDGPWPGSTERILNVLGRYHVHATFFMIGTQAERYPRLVREVGAAGHEIGNHSFDHPRAFDGLSSEQVTAEVSLANEALTFRGTTPTLFRPPDGSFDADVLMQARELGMRTVTWSLDPEDWRPGLSPKQVRRAVLSQIGRGSIVLLHDGGGDALHTIRALPAIIKGIRARGLRLVVIPREPA